MVEAQPKAVIYGVVQLYTGPELPIATIRKPRLGVSLGPPEALKLAGSGTREPSTRLDGGNMRTFVGM